MEISEILARCDHTLLRTDCTSEEIRTLCDQGIRYGVASVCIPPAHVAGAKRYVGNNLRICTVIGFPNGYSTTAVKLFETKNALDNGADEIDMVINVGDLKDKNYQAIYYEISELKKACGSHVLKVIIEACLLTDEEKIKMCQLVTQAGADYIKTSTGFSTGGATKEDVALMKANVGPGVKVKAAGGIRDLEDAAEFVALGADRLGTSRVVKAVKAQEAAKK